MNGKLKANEGGSKECKKIGLIVLFFPPYWGVFEYRLFYWNWKVITTKSTVDKNKN